MWPYPNAPVNRIYPCFTLPFTPRASRLLSRDRTRVVVSCVCRYFKRNFKYQVRFWLLYKNYIISVLSHIVLNQMCFLFLIWLPNKPLKAYFVSNVRYILERSIYEINSNYYQKSHSCHSHLCRFTSHTNYMESHTNDTFFLLLD